MWVNFVVVSDLEENPALPFWIVKARRVAPSRRDSGRVFALVEVATVMPQIAVPS